MNLLQPDSSWRQTSLRPLPSISHGIQQSTFYSLCSNTNLWPPLHNSALLLRVLPPWMTSISTCPFLGTIKPSDTQLATWLPSLLLGRYGCAQKKNVHFYSSRSHTLLMVSNSFSIYSSQKSQKDPSKTCFNQVTLLLSLPMAPRSLRVEAKVLTMVYVALCDLLLTWFPSLIIVLPSIPGLLSPSSPIPHGSHTPGPLLMLFPFLHFFSSIFPWDLTEKDFVEHSLQEYTAMILCCPNTLKYT